MSIDPAVIVKPAAPGFFAFGVEPGIGLYQVIDIGIEAGELPQGARGIHGGAVMHERVIDQFVHNGRHGRGFGGLGSGQQAHDDVSWMMTFC